ncbi:MAG: RHS repeat domain-containing protein, partial [Terriglobia bacterium]
MYASRAQAGRLVIASDYDFNTGLLTATTDPNNQTTAFTYDLMGRTTQINLPDGGQTSFAYNDVVLPFSVTITTKIDATQ